MSLTESTRTIVADASLAVEPAVGFAPFSQTLKSNSLELIRGTTTTLQINVGLVCNQECAHCHVDAGPNRTESMDRATVDDVTAYAARCRFEVADITGGAPEMNPHLGAMIESLDPHVSKIMLRSNLTAAAGKDLDGLIDLCKAHRVTIVASIPSVNKTQLEKQRGKGVYDRCINALQKLNAAGYGRDGSGLELSLVSNPVGAFLPAEQDKLAKKFRADLRRKFDIEFNNLFTFANVPLGRYRQWLQRSGNYAAYMKKLIDGFNPCAIEGLMCRSLVSVAWDGYLYDCDFNLASGLPLARRRTHVTQMEGPPRPGSPIAVSDYCYTCTAGAGFT